MSAAMLVVLVVASVLRDVAVLVMVRRFIVRTSQLDRITERASERESLAGEIRSLRSVIQDSTRRLRRLARE